MDTRVQSYSIVTTRDRSPAPATYDPLEPSQQTTREAIARRAWELRRVDAGRRVFVRDDTTGIVTEVGATWAPASSAASSSSGSAPRAPAGGRPPRRTK